VGGLLESSIEKSTTALKLKLIKVKNITWGGGSLDSYAILKQGPLGKGSIVLPPSLYLLEQAKAAASDNTQRAMGNDLRTYFEALAIANRHWLEITDTQMSSYLKYHLQIELGLSNNSIERSISTLRKTYSYAYSSGFSLDPIEYTFHYVKEEQLKRQGQTTSFQTNLYKKYINERIFNVICANINSAEGFLRERDELVLQLGYHCGLRSAETTSTRNLQTKKINALLKKADESNNLTITVPIVGKGNKLRYVVFNAKITQMIRNFLRGRRAFLPDGPLICSHAGRELSSGHASRLFNRALKTALPKLRWFTRKTNRSNEDVYTISFPSIKKLSFHALRHTYATNLVSFCYDHGFDPWHYLMDQLGHAQESTTKIYILFDANIFHRDPIRKRLSKTVDTQSGMDM
jgi:site-specific recombinase XerD